MLRVKTMTRQALEQMAKAKKIHFTPPATFECKNYDGTFRIRFLESKDDRQDISGARKAPSSSI